MLVGQESLPQSNDYKIPMKNTGNATTMAGTDNVMNSTIPSQYSTATKQKESHFRKHAPKNLVQSIDSDCNPLTSSMTNPKH